ncbi:MAG: 50S ribosomal protein L24e [Euryarchaeota archaeon]|nr:50S ribosomal protein L24e [Euryarchaeota archaeon]
METRVCSFCGNNVEPGTGMMYIKRDGTVLMFCTSKCRKNMLELKRVPRRVRWSQHFERQA